MSTDLWMGHWIALAQAIHPLAHSGIIESSWLASEKLMLFVYLHMLQITFLVPL
jgi:hypothetical protein